MPSGGAAHAAVWLPQASAAAHAVTAAHVSDSVAGHAGAVRGGYARLAVADGERKWARSDARRRLAGPPILSQLDGAGGTGGAGGAGGADSAGDGATGSASSGPGHESKGRGGNAPAGGNPEAHDEGRNEDKVQAKLALRDKPGGIDRDLVLKAQTARAGVLIAVLAALSVNLGKVMQKRGTQDLPVLQFKSSILRSYLSNGWWLVGVVLDVAGALLTMFSLSLAPVSIVQPVLGCGLAFVAIFSHLLTSDRMGIWDWSACGACMLGTIGIGLTTADDGEVEAVVSMLVALPLVLFFGLTGVVSDMLYRWRLLHAEASWSICAGICFGLSASSARCGMVLAQAWGSIATFGGLVGSIVLTSCGFVAQVSDHPRPVSLRPRARLPAPYRPGKLSRLSTRFLLRDPPTASLLPTTLVASVLTGEASLRTDAGTEGGTRHRRGNLRKYGFPDRRGALRNLGAE